MDSHAFETPDATWQRAVVGGIGGSVGFFVAESAVGGENVLRLAVATAAAALVVTLVVTAAINSYSGASTS